MFLKQRIRKSTKKTKKKKENKEKKNRTFQKKYSGTYKVRNNNLTFGLVYVRDRATASCSVFPTLSHLRCELIAAVDAFEG